MAETVPATDRFRFSFRLVPLEQVSPWGAGTPYLSWFGLTQGWFWIEAGDRELFRYAREFLEMGPDPRSEGRAAPLPYEDYPVVRYWEDLLKMLPATLDPLPGDIAARVADAGTWETWRGRAYLWQRARGEDEDAWDAYHAAVGWWDERRWDAGHLAYPPHLHLWRVRDAVHIRWDNRTVTAEGSPVWEAVAGEVRVPVAAFEDSVREFDTRFIGAMAARVRTAGASWPRPGVEIDNAALEREQRERATWAEAALNPRVRELRRAAEWDRVRDAVARIDGEVSTT